MRAAEPADVVGGLTMPVPVAEEVPPAAGEVAGEVTAGDRLTSRPPGPAAQADPFSPFFEANHAALSAYLRRRAPVEVADELTVATFEVAWQRWSDVPAQRPLPWLYGVARRLLANQRRSERRWSRLRSRLAGANRAGGLPPTGRAGPDPAAAAVDALAARQALDLLRPDDREALMLVAWEGLDATAAATSLGITPGAFAVRLHRARQRLEKLLPPEPPTHELPNRLPRT
jgi:RNA polymerase sigma-70 factor (ECF subfamily)